VRATIYERGQPSTTFPDCGWRPPPDRLYCGSRWPTLVELVGDAGNYDYVEFTAVYAPFHMHAWTTWVARWS